MAIKVNQPTAAPTRQIWAVTLTAAILGAVKGVIDVMFPEFAALGLYDLLEEPVYGALIVAAGYFTREVKHEVA